MTEFSWAEFSADFCGGTLPFFSERPCMEPSTPHSASSFFMLKNLRHSIRTGLRLPFPILGKRRKKKKKKERGEKEGGGEGRERKESRLGAVGFCRTLRFGTLA